MDELERDYIFPMMYKDYMDRVRHFAYEAYKQGYNIALAHEIGIREARLFYSKGCINGEIRREAAAT